MDKGKISHDYGVITAREIRVDWNGWTYRTIYGKCKNGWFIAIPNRKISVRAAEPDDIYYNGGELGDLMGSYEEGRAIASAIKEHWEGLER